VLSRRWKVGSDVAATTSSDNSFHGDQKPRRRGYLPTVDRVKVGTTLRRLNVEPADQADRQHGRRVDWSKVVNEAYFHYAILFRQANASRNAAVRYVVADLLATILHGCSVRSMYHVRGIYQTLISQRGSVLGGGSFHVRSSLHIADATRPSLVFIATGDRCFPAPPGGKLSCDKWRRFRPLNGNGLITRCRFKRCSPLSSDPSPVECSSDWVDYRPNKRRQLAVCPATGRRVIQTTVAAPANTLCYLYTSASATQSWRSSWASSGPC